MHPQLASLQTERLSHPDVTPAVWGRLDIPHATPPYPGVILLGGSAGLHAGYEQVGRSFADSGFIALTVDYLAETGVEPSAEERLRHWPVWQATVRNAVAVLQASPLVASRGGGSATSTRGGSAARTRAGIGLVGYSLGAFLAVSAACALPEVSAVVDFFGGGSLDEQACRFPPLLILHGEADHIIPVSFACELRDVWIAHGGEVEVHIYPGADHGFTGPWSPWYSAPEAADSFQRTVEFLGRRLGG